MVTAVAVPYGTSVTTHTWRNRSVCALVVSFSASLCALAAAPLAAALAAAALAAAALAAAALAAAPLAAAAALGCSVSETRVPPKPTTRTRST